MSSHLIFPAPSLQHSATRTLPGGIATRLGAAASALNPALSTSFPKTSLADSSTVLMNDGAVTQIETTSTTTQIPSIAASLVDSPTPLVSFYTGSSESHSALIISSISLMLVVTLIIVLLVWFVILRRQRKKNVRDNPGELMGYLDKERGIPYEGDTDSMGGDDGTREGAEDSRHRADAFNPLSMVAEENVTVSVALSQGTRTSNPPPPYANGITDSGNERVDGVQLDSPDQPAPSNEPTNGRQSLGLNDESNRTRRTVPGAGASFAALARLLPPAMTVRYAFIPASPDEMEVKKGDKLQVTGIFDDGWCLCRAENGRAGVVPLACLDITETTFSPPDPDGSGPQARDAVSVGGVVPGQRGAVSGQRVGGKGSEAIGERKLVDQMQLGLLGTGMEEEKGRLVKSSPRLTSRSVVVVQNESPSNK